MCRALKNLIDTSIKVQYHCECQLTGMEYIGHANVSVHERLEVLRKSRRAWETLDWTQKKVDKSQNTKPGDFAGGILGLLEWKSFTTLSFHSCPSQENETMERVLPFRASEMSLDPAQDLVIFSQIELWRRSIDTSQVAPSKFSLTID